MRLATTTGRRYSVPRSSTLILGLAIFALACAAVGALGPAEHLRTRYSWPPPDLPSTQPARLWYTPLLVARHEPESITARLPCVLPRPLRGAGSPVTVLATARDAAGAGGLAVMRVRGQLLVEIGNDVLARTDLPSRQLTKQDCAYSLTLAGGQWSLGGGPGDLAKGGSLERLPVVNGLFSGLDLRSGERPSIEVTTAVHGSRTTARQKVAWALALLTGLAALILVAGARRPRRPKGVARRAAAHTRSADGVVAVVLLGWWLIGPAFFDDGWVLARQQNFSASGGFSAYYTSFGVNLPLDYWLEWAEHWLMQSTSALLVLRVPALVCLAATWILCRWILSRSVRSPSGGERRSVSASSGPMALWALASAFLVCALAWGMTLRPEPIVCLLVTGVLACVVRFLERGTTAPLAVAAVLVALALSAHPAGLVSLAPLVVAAPRLAVWARPRLPAASTLVLGGLALFGVLALLGSDLRQKRADALSLRAFGDETASWRDELTRYDLLSSAPYGTPLRRESVALLVLAVLAFLLRSRRDRPGRLLDLHAASLGVALVLLIPTPTKWPWHFGTLIGLAAVAVAAETARLGEDARLARGLSARPFFFVGAATLAAAWAWSPRTTWGDLDLRTLDWTLGIESKVTLAKLGGIAPAALLVTLALAELGRRRRVGGAAWRTATSTAPVLAVPLIAFTAGVLVADAARTDSWTLARQNLETLTRDAECGLANDALVASPSSMRPLAPMGAASRGPLAAWVTPAPLPALPRFTLGPVTSPSEPARSQWFALRGERRAGFFVGGVLSSSDGLEVEWGQKIGGRVESLGVGRVSTDFGADARPKLIPWRFLAAGDLPARPKGVNAIRVALRSAVAPGATAALTSPVTYENQPLASELASAGVRTLVIPNLRTYVPCVHQPDVSAGVAGAPDRLLAYTHSIWPLATGTSPFDGMFDLYHARRLPLTDSPNAPKDVAVYELDRHIAGAEQARPLATTLSS
jgi:cell wall arabinan synthesis protein